MPAKIVTTATDSQNGEINQQDLTSIIQDFDSLIQLHSITPRTVIKVNTVSIPAQLLAHLLGKIAANEMPHSSINIKFGITLPDQKDCTDGVTDVSNHLTVVLVIEKNGTEQLNENDFVITPGFKEFSANKEADGACCPVIEPALA